MRDHEFPLREIKMIKMKKLKKLLFILLVGSLTLVISCSDEEDPQNESLQPATKLYYSSNEVLYAYDLESGAIEEIITADEHEMNYIGYIAIDKKSGKVFIANAHVNKILSKNLDGTGELQTLYSFEQDGDAVLNPTTIEFHPSKNEIYWTSNTSGVFAKGSKNGSATPIFDNAFPFDALTMTYFEDMLYCAAYTSISAIVPTTGSEENVLFDQSVVTQTYGADVHRKEKMIYWANIGTDAIAKGDLAGQQSTIIFDSNDGIDSPIYLAIDEVAEKIYWVQLTGNIFYVKRGNTTGEGNIETLFELSNIGNIALDN